MLKKLIIFSFLIFIPILFYAGKNLPSYQIETGALIHVGDNTPFWLFSNQYARYPLKDNDVFADIFLKTEVSQDKFFDYAYGLDFYTNYYGELSPRFQQVYLKGKIWKFYLLGGRFEESYGNQDSLLSSGSLLWSRNARPMPQILIKSDYISFPFTKGFLLVKGMLSHGWFEKDRFDSHSFLHHKNLYFIVGGSLPVNFEYAYEHYAMWGGTFADTSIGKMPTRLKDYFLIFLGKHGDSTAGTPTGEVINVLGNHIGFRNYKLSYKGNKVLLDLYRQDFFEFGSGKRFENWPDGLWGMNFRLKNEERLISGITYEFLFTMNQSMPPPDKPVKKDYEDYFNNYIYRSGWTYDKMTIGTPFMTSPVYEDKDPKKAIENNRVILHHLGIKGKIKSFDYRTLISYSQNYGVYHKSYSPTKKQVSIMFEAATPLKFFNNIVFTARLGIDIGRMYGNNIGVFIGLKKSGNFKKIRKPEIKT